MNSEPLTNTTVDCPTCGEKHSWPACGGNVKRDEREWRDAVFSLFLEVYKCAFFSSKSDAEKMKIALAQFRDEFLSDKTSC